MGLRRENYKYLNKFYKAKEVVTMAINDPIKTLLSTARQQFGKLSQYSPADGMYRSFVRNGTDALINADYALKKISTKPLEKATELLEELKAIVAAQKEIAKTEPGAVSGTAFGTALAKLEEYNKEIKKILPIE